MNSFGQPYIVGVQAGLQIPLYDPRSVREDRRRFRRDDVPDLAHANSLAVPTGRWPVRGWILVARADYNLLSKYATNLQLHIGDTTEPHNVGVLKNLSIVQAQCVTRGLASDPDALYLVELTDVRGVLYNRWFQFPLNAKYNIRAPAYPGVFHPASTNGGVSWTWATMLRDIWERMPLLGAWPGLPATPAGTPEGFWFSGVPAWTSLCDVLEHVGLAVACDLTQDAPYTIVQPGAADAAYATLDARYGAPTSPLYRVEDDLEWIDVGAARVPATVTVLFRRRNEVYGTEETVTFRSDGPYQWDMSAVYAVNVGTPAEFSGSVGTHHLWSDFTVRYDVNNQPLAADVATAAAIAAERVTQYFAGIYRQTLGAMTRRYAGALPFATGSRVDGVRWSMDHRRDYAGWTTDVVRGHYPPFADLWNDMQ